MAERIILNTTTLRLLTLLALCVAVGSSCGSSGTRATKTKLNNEALSLTIKDVRTPRFRVERYKTSGVYPEVSNGGMKLVAVNRAIRHAILADQREYAPDARWAAKFKNIYTRVYRTVIDHRYISASTVVVSVLMPTTRLYPGGSLGDQWLAITVRVPSGKVVSINDLFNDPNVGVKTLAKAWLERARYNSGPRNNWKSCINPYLSDDYAAKPASYREYALTQKGIVVGFPQQETCSRITETVPYSVLEPYLSKSARVLITGVRLPQWKSR
jgi:hypothetical protein